jgi:hypothetical protein
MELAQGLTRRRSPRKQLPSLPVEILDMIIHFALPTLLHNGGQLTVRTVSPWCRILPEKKIVVSLGEIRCALSLMLTCRSFRDTVYKIVYPRARIYWAGIDGPHLPLPVQAFSLIQEFRICVMWLYDEERFERFLGILRNFNALKCLTLDHVEIPNRRTDDYPALMVRAPALMPQVYDPMILWTLQTITNQSSQLHEIVEDHDGKSVEHPWRRWWEQDDNFLRGRFLYGKNWVGRVSICVPGYPIGRVANLNLQYELELWKEFIRRKRLWRPMLPQTRETLMDWYFYQCGVCLLDGNPRLTAREQEKAGSAGSMAAKYPRLRGAPDIVSSQPATNN